MIDFRYHLVSLISVFLALAVGIVLGAGPLRDTLGEQLSGQVEQLRGEQEDLRAQAEDLEASNDQLSSFITEVGPDLVRGTMAGEEVVIITDHTSTRTPVDRIESLLGDAGVSSTVQISLSTTLWDPDEAERRSDAVAALEEISPQLVSTEDEDATDSELLAAAIVHLLPAAPGSTGEQAEPVVPDPEDRTAAWQTLIDQQLISVDGQIPSATDAVVYAAADPSQFVVDGDDEAHATERAQGQLAAQTSLLGELTDAGTPAVVAAATPGNVGTTGILRTARADARFADVSTTDRLQESDGAILAVLALIEQTRGGEGSYGTTTEARDRLPELPSTSSDAAPSDGGEG